MAIVINRVDLLACVAADACMRDAAAGAVSVPLASAAAYYLRGTVRGGWGEPLKPALWEPEPDPVVEDGADLQPRFTRGVQIYASGRLHRRILESEDETLCRNEVLCRADAEVAGEATPIRVAIRRMGCTLLGLIVHSPSLPARPGSRARGLVANG